MTERRTAALLATGVAIPMAALVAMSLTAPIDAVVVALMFAVGALALRGLAEVAVRAHQHRHR